jgi:hypothetical protein
MDTFQSLMVIFAFGGFLLSLCSLKEKESHRRGMSAHAGYWIAVDREGHFGLFTGPFRLDSVFSATAARTRAIRASSSIWSPLWKSMARLVLPSRLELKSPEGSFSEAPL